MIRSNPHNLARIYAQGRADSSNGIMNEKPEWTVRQHQEYLEGWYSLKTRNGSLPGRVAYSSLDQF
jgi:hypothetical protein